MAVNVKLLKKVRKLIAEEPRRLDMEEWGYKVDAEERNRDDAPPCGAVACLAGWTVLAAAPKNEWPKMFKYGELRVPGSDVGERAAVLLGIKFWDCPFYETGWGVHEVLAWIDRQIAAASK